MTADNAWALTGGVGDSTGQGQDQGQAIGAPIGPGPSGLASRGGVLACSRGWGVGLSFGAFFVLSAGQVEIAFDFPAPVPSQALPPYPQIWISGPGSSASPLAGFWITSAGMVLVLSVGIGVADA